MCKLSSVCTSPTQQGHRCLVWSLWSGIRHPDSQSIIFMLKFLIYITQLQEFLVCVCFFFFFPLLRATIIYENTDRGQYYQEDKKHPLINVSPGVFLEVSRCCLVPCSFWLLLCQNHISIKGGQGGDYKSPPVFEQEKVIQTQPGKIYGQRNLRNAWIMRNTQIFLSHFLSNHQRVTE